MSEPGTSVLLVDDDEAKRYTTAHVLRRAGFDVIEAATGADALARAHEEPGLIILDVKLPDMDGFEVARRLRHTAAASIPVLHLSATFVRSEHQAKGLESGAVGYLTYPLDPLVLVAQARALLRLSRAERERERSLRRERAARTLAEVSQYRFRFLADLGRVLTGSLTPGPLLSSALSLLVPGLVSGAVIVLERPVGDRQVLARHRDSGRQARLEAWAERGRTELLAAAALMDVTEGQGTIDAVEAPAELGGAQGVMMVSIQFGGTHQGALLLLRDQGQGGFGEEDRLLMQEVANRVGSALANAQSFAVAQQEQARAEQANAAKDRFLAALSHELRTPLSAILGWVEGLRRGRLAPAEQGRALEVIERNAKVQLQLIDDLLDVSRIVTGKLHLALAPVELAHAVASVLESLRHLAAVKGVELALRAHPRQLWVEGDAGRLQQVVWNLVSNAIKFTPAEGRVDVELEPEDAMVVLRVRDTGQGIGADLLPRIFETFFQGAQGAVGSERGLGLGLSIVRDLVERHGGVISAESAGPGRGACFTVRLPRLFLEALTTDQPRSDHPPDA